ncbi:telomere recombination-domain-containing protein [Lasiosphaeria ovina]|uniref:Threonylcarbamoyl-AMP synthase n=1 Tax=Lasiosphaeria ovina TaxID=92902 RepID=A0AAE0NKW5_9PEZI|nr:telomere recombination-domain-containing protein [Lasiosphaeria ovina]
MKTRIIKVQQQQQQQQGDDEAFGRWAPTGADSPPSRAGDGAAAGNTKNLKMRRHLDRWEVPYTSLDQYQDQDQDQDKAAAAVADDGGALLAPLIEAGAYLRTSDVPVAFPTETVYGLGADATRSAAVRGIYAAKGRPSDNPLIVHVCDLDMLRRYLEPAATTPQQQEQPEEETIPAIYLPLIERFWPGPLTILLPNPQPSQLAAEVTAGLATFGCRMPASGLARTLIQLAGAPLAAPSANASTRPSPTAAAHVREDLDGRIELILDGGPCAVGVESTVVDGLCDPPAVLRPGGVSIDALRACPGWHRVEKAYKDHAEMGAGNGDSSGKETPAAAAAQTAPRAPGMKYKHYSPKARVVLYEAAAGVPGAGAAVPSAEDLERALRRSDEAGERQRTIAVIRTWHWPVAAGLPIGAALQQTNGSGDDDREDAGFAVREGTLLGSGADNTEVLPRLLDVDLGRDVRGVAHGLFAALRELDRRQADVIFVEGVSDGEDIAAAVMNRLRKAASDIRPFT